MSKPRDVGIRAGIADLLLGAQCPVCGIGSAAVCGVCIRDLRPEPFMAIAGPPPVISAGHHDGTVRQVLVAWKEQPALALTGIVAHMLAVSVCVLAAEADSVQLVPIPGTRRSRRARGVHLMGVLAQQTSRLLQTVGLNASVNKGLYLHRQTLDQRGLGAADRRANLRGAFRAVPLRGRQRPAVIVVDDVVTTGATLNEAFRALQLVETSVLGAATISARV